MNVLLIGNYGVGNIGDEALRGFFVKTFPDIPWTVVSAHPEKRLSEVARLPGGLHSLLSLSWVRTIGVYRKCDAVCFGGGSLFTDAESSYACFLWWLHAMLGWMWGKPILLAFQGIGPCRTGIARWCTKWVLRRAVYVSVRDMVSMRRAQEWAPEAQLIQSFDPVFVTIKEKFQIPNSKFQRGSALVLIPRGNIDASFLQKAQEHVRRFSAESVSILLLQPENPAEKNISQMLASRVSVPSHVREVHALDELADAIKDSSFVFSARYHGVIAAVAAGVPFEAHMQAEGDKLNALQEMAAMGSERLQELVEDGISSLKSALKR